MLRKTTADTDTAGPLVRTDAANAIGNANKKDRAELQQLWEGRYPELGPAEAGTVRRVLPLLLQV